MFGSKMRDKLPCIQKSDELDDKEVRDRDAEKKEKGIEYED